ncbi:MAG: sugar phosphate isomerase/epimerase and 4-hydroxyphenylpyruvate domain-containing protein [Rhodospirillum sp.]|nr:sugar phosphate isomerase/epimerase and 4-hydroxyphenylpyruvate domain-containing protein [Rhodospirillum sp.]MCF8490642.1 sugar phosphate isomerase/epimerase and 4-hydroxyphenylpyruvate domain-containing protein [Rhodospirillum sp.]MCF8500728.1 sugar phosphate isomerase/epimerase and 4-hydroxyphenylpyruvate domain-containing protein [Rhodospirillum sp.]
MKTSIATVSIAGTLKEKLAAIAAAGFDGIEIFENDFLAFDGSPREVGAMARDHGLEITLFQPFRDFEGMPEPHRTRAFDRAERKFDLMEDLGTDLVLVCSSVSPIALGGIDRIAEDFHALGEQAAQRGLRVGYEALAWGRHINDHRDAWEVVRRANHPNVGLILDSFHSLSRKIESDTIRAIPGDKIFFLQLADAPLIDMDLLYWSRHFRTMPGEGDLPVVDFMRAVAATGYGGPVSLEIFNDQFRGGSPQAISVDGHRSLMWLMDTVRREEPDIRIEVPAMPGPRTLEAVEFVEFATDGQGALDLEEDLVRFGFTRTARHRSKAVTLWHQGEMSILVNREATGHARAAFEAHGTTVCDIGLRVDDARATFDRAVALGAQGAENPAGPGELAIPAIQGLRGGLIHFLDGSPELSRFREIDFLPLAPSPSPPRPVGLVRVDHLAQTMTAEDMPGWVLFYTTLFKTRKTPVMDVVDPAGLIRSQAIESLGGGPRITLNGAENRRTVAGRFLVEGPGSSIQHLALLTDDLFASAEALRENGFRPLEISRNYHDDLEARLGLEPTLGDRLRQGHILLDQSGGGGRYLQLYGPTRGDGFFFEIVERSGGYDGYGAPNAPFRIAAQKRRAREPDARKA